AIAAEGMASAAITNRALVVRLAISDLPPLITTFSRGLPTIAQRFELLNTLSAHAALLMPGLWAGERSGETSKTGPGPASVTSSGRGVPARADTPRHEERIRDRSNEVPVDSSWPRPSVPGSSRCPRGPCRTSTPDRSARDRWDPFSVA